MYPSTAAFPSDGRVGLLLRDYFAIRVLQALHPENVAMNDEQRKQAAEYAYRMADSMMVARED